MSANFVPQPGLKLSEAMLAAIPLINEVKGTYLIPGIQSDKPSACALGGAYYVKTGLQRCNNAEVIANAFNVPIDLCKEISLKHMFGGPEWHIKRCARHVKDAGF